MRMQAQGMVPGQTALNETQLAAEREQWRELTEEAEADWRFFEPERYYQYQTLLERREEELQAQWKRKYEGARLCAEADVALDEFVGAPRAPRPLRAPSARRVRARASAALTGALCSAGILVDLGWAEDPGEVEVAGSGVSALSGAGRELGLDPSTESALRVAGLAVLGVLATAPLLQDPAAAADPVLPPPKNGSKVGLRPGPVRAAPRANPKQRPRPGWRAGA